MATRVTYQPCAVCKTKFPVRPQAPHAKFCSTKCRMQHHRQQKQEAVQPKIINEEISEMNNAPMLYVFQESEFKSRCAEAKVRYENNIESPVARAKGRIVEFSIVSIEEAFNRYHELRVEGYGVLDSSSPLPSVNVGYMPVGALVTLYMTKPQHSQESDLEAIYADVRSQYEAELERELEEHLDRTVQSLIDAEDRAKAKAEAELLDARQQEKRAEALAAREKLRAELIEAGKLKSDGSSA